MLAIDGGGVRGIFAAALLAGLEEDLGRPVVEMFDLVVGTSTGGIIALGLGAGLTPREILDFYVTGGGTLYEVLADVTAKMPGLVEVRDGAYWVANPVQPDENFAGRWCIHPGRDQRFFQWMQQVQKDVSGYGAERGVDRVLEKIAKSFGDRSAQRAGASLGTGAARARETGMLGMAAGTGLLATTSRPSRPVPQHTFHGSLPGRRA